MLTACPTLPNHFDNENPFNPNRNSIHGLDVIYSRFVEEHPDTERGRHGPKITHLISAKAGLERPMFWTFYHHANALCMKQRDHMIPTVPCDLAVPPTTLSKTAVDGGPFSKAP